MSYLIIPNLQIHASSIHSTGFLVGGAPVCAASLFSHALARELCIQDKGCIIVHHDRQDLGSYTYGRFHPQQRRSAVFISKTDYSSKNKHALALQPTASAHLSISLLIEFDRTPQTSQVERWLERSKFAGGQITSFKKPSVYNGYWEAVDALPRGWALLDRSSWLTEYMKTHDCDRRRALVRLLSQQSKDSPFLSATVLGYALLETPKHKSGVREGYEHAYSEPLVGLVQYVPIAHYQANADPDKSKPYEELPLLWKREWLKSNKTITNPHVFLITQTEEE